MDTKETNRQTPPRAKRPADPNRRPAGTARTGTAQKRPAGSARTAAPVKRPAPERTKVAAKRPAPERTRAPAKRSAPARKPVQAPRQPKPEPEIVYTPAKPFNRNRLLLQLGIVAAVVLAVFFSLSLFFKVKVEHKDPKGGQSVTTITVSGNQKYSAEAIINASGIQDGDSLLTLNDAKISGKIITALPYVNSVRIGIKLPDTVNIEIEELDIVYAVADSGGLWWLMNSDGRLIEKTDAAAASEYTKILGIALDLPMAGQQAVAQEPEPAGTEAEGETTLPQPVTISGAQRLQTALTILQYLEENSILGEVVSVDVTNMGNIELWYGQRFKILLGDSTELKYKIDLAVAAADQLKDHDRGILDVSFAVRQEVVYTPQAD